MSRSRSHSPTNSSNRPSLKRRRTRAPVRGLNEDEHAQVINSSQETPVSSNRIEKINDERQRKTSPRSSLVCIFVPQTARDLCALQDKASSAEVKGAARYECVCVYGVRTRKRLTAV